MRTNIVIDGKVMKETLRLKGLKTKREAVGLDFKPSCASASKMKLGSFEGAAFA